MMYPTGMLVNTATNRFHPISFRPAPMPGPVTENSLPRYKSLGHHTDGFDTIEEANKWIDEQDAMCKIDYSFDWLGDDIPAVTTMIPPEMLTNG